jgi:hypothetical protein
MAAAEALYFMRRDHLVGTWDGVDVELRGARTQLARLAGDAPVTPWAAGGSGTGA